jgi:hypothetical protein
MTASKASIAATELSLLRLLLEHLAAIGPGDHSTASAVWSESAGNLADMAGYRWADEEHRVVFESLRQMQRRGTASSLRQELAAEATRIGHPDVDWATYFTAPEPGANLPNLLRKLTSAAAGE